MLQIVQAPHPVLSEKTKKINKIDASVKRLIDDMVYTLIHTKDPEGVGLAAPQVAKALQLFVIKESPEDAAKVFINPQIVSLGKELYPVTDGGKKKGVKLEGCLSLKDIWGIVHRSSSVTLKYQDENGKEYTKTFTGFLATIIQHECDHLNGILFPKRVLEQNEKLYKATEDEKGETVFEEIEI